MKNTICEKWMWRAMTPAIFKYISGHCKHTDIADMKKKSRRIFADMTVRISGMGAFTKNHCASPWPEA